MCPEQLQAIAKQGRGGEAICPRIGCGNPNPVTLYACELVWLTQVTAECFTANVMTSLPCEQPRVLLKGPDDTSVLPYVSWWVHAWQNCSRHTRPCLCSRCLDQVKLTYVHVITLTVLWFLDQTRLFDLNQATGSCVTTTVDVYCLNLQYAYHIHNQLLLISDDISAEFILCLGHKCYTCNLAQVTAHSYKSSNPVCGAGSCPQSN